MKTQKQQVIEQVLEKSLIDSVVENTPIPTRVPKIFPQNLTIEEDWIKKVLPAKTRRIFVAPKIIALNKSYKTQVHPTIVIEEDGKIIELVNALIFRGSVGMDFNLDRESGNTCLITNGEIEVFINPLAADVANYVGCYVNWIK